jgi:lipopolysaccharide/colanic/teichoic acid biosynthesis glycosyltransferase
LRRLGVDELPQLVNVLKGEMSLVGPRPEDPSFVEPRRTDFEQILRVRPGITGLSQLAFAKEMAILDPADRVGDYERRLLPAKLFLDEFYVAHSSLRMYLRILLWTVVAVVLRRDVAVSRKTGHMNLRRRPRAVQGEAAQMGGVAS